MGYYPLLIQRPWLAIEFASGVDHTTIIDKALGEGGLMQDLEGGHSARSR